MRKVLSVVLTRKVFNTLFVPAFITGFQIFARWYNNADSSVLLHSLGVSLAATALGQMFPFIILDHFLLNKVYIVEAASKSDNSVGPIYQVKQNRDRDAVSNLQVLTVFLFSGIMFLFIITVLMAYQDPKDILHNFLGLSCVIISCLYVLKA